MSCNLGKTGTRFTAEFTSVCRPILVLVEHFKLSARTKDTRDTRDTFLVKCYPCIGDLDNARDLIKINLKKDICFY